MDTATIWPLDIVLHEASGQLEVLFNDGVLGRISAATLRSACRCAGCESARRAGQPPAGNASSRLAELRPVGDIGLQLCFADGHDRGIFPWAFLHELSRP